MKILLPIYIPCILVRLVLFGVDWGRTCGTAVVCVGRRLVGVLGCPAETLPVGIIFYTASHRAFVFSFCCVFA